MKHDKNRKLRQALGIMILAATLGLPLGSMAAPSGNVMTNPLVLGRAAFAQKNYARAVQILDSAAKTDKYKNSSECRLELGRALYKLGAEKQGVQQKDTYKQAVRELRTAVKLGKGSSNSIEANTIMLSMPRSITAPRMGADTPMIAMANGIRGMERGGEPSRPKVLEFYASWCEPCSKLKPILARVKAEYKDRVEFVSYDIDIQQSEKVVQDYDVSPIPTLIFLDASNQVITYSIGYSGENDLKQGMKKILPPA